jgi:lipopolysaccharide export system permease protein
MFKNKLNNYLIFNFLKAYFFVLIVFTILLWITQSGRLIYLITDNGLSFQNFVNYIFLQLPKIASQLMLISIVISFFISIIKLHSSKEIEIYLLSGISKKYIIKIVIKISLFFSLLAILFYFYLAPLSSLKSRQILANSEFSVINNLVKKNNFNSVLKNLTIFVHKNDNRGNLEKIFIFEDNKTIISKKGRVLNINEKNFLELTDGIIHQKNEDNDISTIKFKTTLYDFTKYQTNVVTYPKLQERDFFWVLKNYKANNDPDYLYEINKRIFKPLFIPLISILCCFILYSNNEKINLHKLRIIIFCFCVILIISIEILLNLSILNIYLKYFLYVLPFVGSVLSYYLLSRFLNKETITS